MNREHEGLLICDDLTCDYPIDRMLAEKIPKSPNAKVICGSFGRFNINELPEFFRKQTKEDRDMKYQSLYQQEPFEHKGKPYRCICNSLDIRFGAVIDLELSETKTGRVLAKSVYQNKFKKTYENYGEFLKEWEEIK